MTPLSQTLLSTIINELRNDPDAVRELRDLLTDQERGNGLLTPAEAAARLCVHPKTLTRAAAAGRVLGAVRVGRHWRFDRAVLALEPPAGVSSVPAPIARLHPRTGRRAADAIRGAIATA